MNGTVTTVVGPFGAEADAIAVLPDGRFVVVGASTMAYPNNAYSEDMALVRYLPDGVLDTSFGTDGIVTYDGGTATRNEHARAVVLQPDGEMLVTGPIVNIPSTITARFEEDGSLDEGFGTMGTVVTSFGSSVQEARGIALQPDGKVLVVGYTYADIALIRYTPDGALDPTFDGDGRMLTDIGNSYDYGTAIGLEPDGRFVVAGYTSYLCSDRDFAVVRYTNDISTAVQDATMDGSGLAVRYDAASRIVHVDLTLDRAMRPCLQLLDAAGRTMLVKELGERSAGRVTEALDLSALAEGAYLLRLAGAGQRAVRAVVVH